VEEKQRSPSSFMNILDRAINWVSPKLGYARMAWRGATRGAYNAGDISRNSEGWVPINAKAEQVNQLQRDFVRARTRHAERNSDMIGGIVGILERNVVGTGFRVQAMTSDEELNTRVEEVFIEWQKPQNCDVTETQAFWEICKMNIRRTEVDGGILLVKTYSGNTRFPFQLQLREVDDLDSNGVMKYGENAIINGVEVDRKQKPIAYHFKIFSADGWFTGKTERILAKNVYALWKKTLPSQVREFSQLAPAISRINDTEEYLDTISIKEKILASFAAFIKRNLPTSGMPGRGAPQSVASKEYDPQTGYKRKRITPGMLMDLQPGDDVTSVVPNGQATNAKELTTLFQRLVGAGQGLSYEATSRDMSEVNYSSARQGLLEDQRTYADWQQWLNDHFLGNVYEEVITSAVLSGELNIPDFWQNKAKYLKHRWIEPGWSWIDPVKEANANKIAMATGQDNLANICARVGYDWREILEQRAKEFAYKKELEAKYGITMDIEGGKKVVTTKPGSKVGE
jgi:lambda family phage portal protein